MWRDISFSHRHYGNNSTALLYHTPPLSLLSLSLSLNNLHCIYPLTRSPIERILGAIFWANSTRMCVVDGWMNSTHAHLALLVRRLKNPEYIIYIIHTHIFCVHKTRSHTERLCWNFGFWSSRARENQYESLLH